MKKVCVLITFVMIIFISLIVVFSYEGNTKLLSQEQSKKNFTIYKSDIEKVLKLYDYKMEEVLD